MKIKKIAYILCGLLLVSCNDSFLERYPDTDLSDKTYFTSEKDLELYTNTFYNITITRQTMLLSILNLQK